MANVRVSLITPTYRNNNVLSQMLNSVMFYTNTPIKYFIVDNGGEVTEQMQFRCPTTMIKMPGNSGWIGGINAGLHHAGKETDFILMMNDDTVILQSDPEWLNKMIAILDEFPGIVAVGPTSNAVAGMQSMNIMGLPDKHESCFLSGFCLLIRRSFLDETGGLDDTLPGADDVELSLRAKLKGHKLAVCRTSFVFHYYATTGKKLHPDWDNAEWTGEINSAVIKKHGLKNWLHLMTNDLRYFEGVAK